MSVAKRMDLWPSDLLSAPDDKSPTAVLQEQAELLGEKTQNTVLATVETSGDDMASRLEARFILVAPLLDNYRYVLFRIYWPTDGYPVKIRWNDTEYVADDERGFRQYIQNILASHHTKKVINTLYHESKLAPRGA